MLAGKIVRHHKAEGKGSLVMRKHYLVRLRYVFLQQACPVTGSHGTVVQGKFRNDRLRRIRILSKRFRHEDGNAVYTAEIHSAVRSPAMRVCVELIALQPVGTRIVPDFPAFRIETGESLVRTQPQIPCRIFLDSVDHIVRKSVRGGKMQGSIPDRIIAVESRAGRYPHKPVVRLVEILDGFHWRQIHGIGKARTYIA